MLSIPVIAPFPCVAGGALKMVVNLREHKRLHDPGQPLRLWYIHAYEAP